MLKTRKHLPTSPPPSSVATPIATTQFGASLQFIKENNGGDPIPPIVKQCVEFLDTPDGEFLKRNSIIDMLQYAFVILNVIVMD